MFPLFSYFQVLMSFHPSSAFHVLSILLVFCQWSVRQAILPVSLPHRPSETEHFRNWAQVMLTSESFIFMTDLNYATVHCYFLLMQPPAALLGDKLWPLRWCFVAWKTREVYKCISFVWVPLVACSCINQGQMRIYICSAQFPSRPRISLIFIERTILSYFSCNVYCTFSSTGFHSHFASL